MNAKLSDVGMNKTVVSAREVWELDPFAELHVWDSGVNKENLEDFILGEPKIDIFIDEMDSLSLKAMARFICKKARIPVLMATDNGDEVLLDIERFDLKNFTIKAKDVDIKRAQEMLKYDWFKHPKWKNELEIMLEKKYKAELEALSGKGLKFVTETYLPDKIKNKDFLP